MILSYILHGHVPYYDKSSPHPDPILHRKLLESSCDLLGLDIDFLTDHFSASRFSYSTQALPVNVLLDTLVRPLGETEDVHRETCVKWSYDHSRAVSHVVIGQTDRAGGQWVDNPVQASWEIGTLSYAGMISLPGYGFDEHYQRRQSRPMPVYLRPPRRAVADYLAAYPAQVGISDSIHNGEHVSGVTRRGSGFFIASHNINCRTLILASGIFSELIPPRSLLRPLAGLCDNQTKARTDPLLVVGSGFSAADVIISSPMRQRVLHIYKWAPSTSPSPLRACHQQAYPEYASVYRRMKLAAISSNKLRDKRPKPGPNLPGADSSRDWPSTYEGLPNTEIVDVQIADDELSAVVTLRRADKNEPPFQRRIGGFAYVVGRRGSLEYLSPALLQEVLSAQHAPENATHGRMISGQTLREKANEDLELAPHVFAIGSITGDSLIRFAYGGCAYAAGKIMQFRSKTTNGAPTGDNVHRNGMIKACSSRYQTPTSSPRIRAMNGLDGHEASPVNLGERGAISLDRHE